MNSQIKILLADESAVFLEQLRHVLERDPAFVIAGSANDAQRAVELLHRTQPDILILGLLLPERDGVSVLTAANALPRPPMTLALTGALTEQDAQKLETLGVRYMIRKPCKLQAVAACVRKMLAAVQEMSHLSSDAEALIDGVLRELGVPGVLKGCRYLREAALLAAGDLAGARLEEIYARVAKASLTTASRVERAIGHAIAIAWGGDAELLPGCGITSLACGRTPTNADCIAHLAGQLQSRHKAALPC